MLLGICVKLVYTVECEYFESDSLIYFMIPLLCNIRSLLYYIYSACAIVYAFSRISRGLELTFESRKDTLIKHMIVLFTYFIYAIILVVLYIAMTISEHGESDKGNGANSITTTTLKYILALFLGCRHVLSFQN